MNMEVKPVEPAVDVPAPVAKKPPFVMICVPSGRSWEARTSTSVAGLMTFSALNGISVGIINLEGSMITKQRCDIVEMVRKNNADYMFFIDSDMKIPPDALIRLLKHDKEIVGATYNKRVPPFETLGRLKGPKPSEEELAKGGLREAEQLPGGCLLIKMSVFEKITWPWFFECYQWPGENGVEAFKNQMRDSFSCYADEDALASIEGTKFAHWLNEVHKIENTHKWEFYSEDLSFIRKCIKAGISCWCDLSLTFETIHLGVQEVLCASPQARPTDSVVLNAVM